MLPRASRELRAGMQARFVNDDSFTQLKPYRNILDQKIPAL
jgi:hypothetical protein